MKLSLVQLKNKDDKTNKRWTFITSLEKNGLDKEK